MKRRKRYLILAAAALLTALVCAGAVFASDGAQPESMFFSFSSFLLITGRFRIPTRRNFYSQDISFVCKRIWHGAASAAYFLTQQKMTMISLGKLTMVIKSLLHSNDSAPQL